MSYLSRLIGRAPRAEDPPPAMLPMDFSGLRPELPQSDPPDIVPSPAAPETAQGRRFILEPYFLLMEYTDASGNRSRRRITTRHVDDRGATRYLVAVCHERNALRTFRLDRIDCFISADGEVEDPDRWFAEILPVSDSIAIETRAARGTAARPSASLSPYTALRRQITPGLVFLITSSRSDEFLHPGEIDGILRWVEDEAFAMRAAGHLPELPDADGFDKIERTIRRLRPTREDLVEALVQIAGWEVAGKHRLAHALALTARADGKVDDAEAEIYDELRAGVARQHGFGWDEGAGR